MQPNSPVFFLDKNHGKLTREILGRVDIQVLGHKDLNLHPDTKDVTIIKECAARNLILLSGDRAMERVPEERQAIIDNKCKVFMFEDTDKTRTEDWIASFLVGRQRIFEIIAKTQGPLFVTIKPCRHTKHVSKVRFVEKAGGGWLAEENIPPITLPAIEHPHGEHRPPKKQQGVLEFDKAQSAQATASKS